MPHTMFSRSRWTTLRAGIVAAAVAVSGSIAQGGAPEASSGITIIKINFQDATSEGHPGYLPDNGFVFADRGNGFSYGWNQDNSGNARNRNEADPIFAPDERYDTFNHLQRGSGPWIWEIGLPNGAYQVHIVGGDPSRFDQTVKIRAEGVLVVDGAPCTTIERFREGTATVDLNDGRLTVMADQAAGAVNSKISFMEIRTLVRVNFQNVTSLGYPGYMIDNGLPFESRGNGIFYGWNRDNSGNARNRNQLDPKLSPDERYDTFNNLQKPGGPWIWEIAVPIGVYRIHIVGGDPNNFDQTIKIKAEEVLVVDGAPCTTEERFREGTESVLVQDGRLSVMADEAAGAVNAKISFLEVLAEDLGVVNPPNLTIGRMSDGVTITWPTDATDFWLESASTVTGPWAAVRGITTNSATLQFGPGAAFFRMKR